MHMTGKVVGFGVALALALALGATACGGDDDSDSTGGGSTVPAPAPVCGGGEAREGVEVIPTGEYDHVAVGQAVAYPAAQYGCPPAWGTHWDPPGWADCGFYIEAVPNEAAVHSLEHGVVWIAYDPELPEAELAGLEAIAEEKKVVVSPVEGLRAPVVASAWGVQLDVASGSDPALAAFVDEYVDGDASPEPGALCDSGVVNPGNAGSG